MKKEEFAAIMQPTYLPWIGDFDLIDFVDKYLFFDNVQLVKRNWDTRNRIKSSNGELFLTIPIEKTAKRDETMLNNAILDLSSKWKEKHIKSVELAYKKAPFFNEVFPIISDILNYDEKNLAKFIENSIKVI